MSSVPRTILLSVVLAACCQAAYITVSMAGLRTFGREDLIGGAAFPTGSQVFDGVPFELGSSAADGWAWNANNATGANPRILEISVGVFGVDSVYTLMSTFWGSSQPSRAQIEFVGSDDGHWIYDLWGNDDIRDYNNGVFTNTIQAPTVQVQSNASQRIDRQYFDLPATFLDETLVTIRLIDNGDTNVQRLFLSGLTVDQQEAVPEPATALLLAGGLLAAASRRRRRG